MTIGTPQIGATSTGVNATVNPTLPPSPAVGDLLLCFASIRTTAGSPDQPAGWHTMLDMGNVKVFGAYMAADTVAPSVTFTGGVAGADTQAAIIKVPGAAPNQLTGHASSAGQENASAQNIAYPALNVPGNGNLVLIVAWKQDDASSIAAPGGFTGIVNSLVTAGDDASLRVVYQLQTTETDIGAGSLTVTGGAAAISKAAVLAIAPAATFAATVQDAVYPPRVALSVSDLLGGESIEIYRVVGATRTLVRGGQVTNDAGTAYVTIDAELPFGTPMHWVAVVNGAEYISQTETLELTGGGVVLTDAISGLAATVAILAWPEKMYRRRVSVYQLANGDTKTISGRRANHAASRIELFTETDTARETLQTLLEEATSNVIQLRQPGGYSDVDCYISVTEFAVRRYSQDGTDQRRVFALDVAEVNSWQSGLEAAGYTYADLEALYEGLTYTDLEGDYTTYLDLALAELE